MVKLPPPALPTWLARQVPFDRYCVPVGERTLHVMESGHTGRPVLLLHGNPTWSYLWRAVAEALRGAPLRLIMPDLVGLGFSERPEAGFHTLANHARVIGALIDALDLRNLVFVGQDWGGPIGARALADRPDRVGGLVILNTLLGPPRPESKSTRFHRFARGGLAPWVAFRLLGFPQRSLHKVQGDPRSIRGEVARAYRYPLRGLRRNEAPLALARMVPDSLSHPSVPDLIRCQEFAAAFKGPTGIVWGERDPILGRGLKRTMELLPEAKVVRTQAGHFLQEEVPSDIAAMIRYVAGC